MDSFAGLAAGLRESLPSGHLAAAEKDLMSSFKNAATSITQLYKESLNANKRHFSAGYLACLADIQRFIQSGLDLESAEGMRVSRVLDYVEGRMEAVKWQEEEEIAAQAESNLHPSASTSSSSAAPAGSAAAAPAFRRTVQPDARPASAPPQPAHTHRPAPSRDFSADSQPPRPSTSYAPFGRPQMAAPVASTSSPPSIAAASHAPSPAAFGRRRVPTATKGKEPAVPLVTAAKTAFVPPAVADANPENAFTFVAPPMPVAAISSGGGGGAGGGMDDAGPHHLTFHTTPGSLNARKRSHAATLVPSPLTTDPNAPARSSLTSSEDSPSAAASLHSTPTHASRGPGSRPGVRRSRTASLRMTIDEPMDREEPPPKRPARR